MPHDWQSAMLLQAKSDYEILLQLLSDDEIPACQKLHYLQMTTEKFAKAYRTEPGGDRFAPTHNAFAFFVQKLAGRKEFRTACGYRDNKPGFRSYINGLAPIAQAIGDLSPEGGDHPNPEYPWESDGVIYVPAEYAFPDLNLRSVRMNKLLKFLEICFSLS